eukprot:scaffold52_cov246-Pinguiococcus_pyrenoidosus.AAC.5
MRRRFPGVLEITLCSADGTVLATAASPYADVETTDDDSQSRFATCVMSATAQAKKVLNSGIRYGAIGRWDAWILLAESDRRNCVDPPWRTLTTSSSSTFWPGL